MTKSKGIGRGGPRKGSGRPHGKEGAKVASFSTRITQKTRDLLDAEARIHDEPVAGVAEQLLLIGLAEKDRRRKTRTPLRALCFLLDILAKDMLWAYSAEMEVDSDPERTWRSNPYLFEAFRSGILTLLDEMRPPGEVVVPPPRPEPFANTPEGQAMIKRGMRLHLPNDPGYFGNRCAWRLIEVARSVKRSIEYSRDHHPDFHSHFMTSKDPATVREQYGLIDAWHDLGLKGPEDYWPSVSESKPDTDDGEPKK